MNDDDDISLDQLAKRLAWRRAVGPTSDLNQKELTNLLVSLDCGVDQAKLDRLWPFLEQIGVQSKPYAHQAEAIVWMVRKELTQDTDALKACVAVGRSLYNVGWSTIDLNARDRSGGILADSMGLGKTYEALVAARVADALVKPKTPTLVVCPASLLLQWQEQIELHTGQLAHLHHGNFPAQRNRALTMALERGVPFVLTTYGTLASDFKLNANANGLFALEWHRLVLDEAHICRNQETLQFKAVDQLKSPRLWCLSGTPINNGPLDCAAYCHLLGHQPFAAAQYWKALYHTKSDLCLWRKHYLMRRDKRILSLPPLLINLHALELGPKEQQLYDQMQSEALLAYQAWQQAHGPEKKVLWGTLLEALLRKRQVCLHSALLLPDADLDPLLRAYRLRCLGMRAVGCSFVRLGQPHKPVLEFLATLPLSWWAETTEPNLLRPCFCGREKVRLGFGNAFVCPEHLDLVPLSTAPCFQCDRQESQYKLLACGHSVCAQCQTRCNLCPAFERAGSLHSSKLDLFRAQLATVPVGEKVVVFSQFTRLLKLLRVQLEIDGYSVGLFDGSLSLKGRHQLLARFTAAEGPRVLLCQIVAGGLGLNLVVANHVFVMEPWWNPMVEKQAIDRTHRIGQQRPVTVHRYKVQETVEEKVYEICARKTSQSEYITRGELHGLPAGKSLTGLMSKLFEM